MKIIRMFMRSFLFSFFSESEVYKVQNVRKTCLQHLDGLGQNFASQWKSICKADIAALIFTRVLRVCFAGDKRTR